MVRIGVYLMCLCVSLRLAIFGSVQCQNLDTMLIPIPIFTLNSHLKVHDLSLFKFYSEISLLKSLLIPLSQHNIKSYNRILRKIWLLRGQSYSLLCNFFLLHFSFERIVCTLSFQTKIELLALNVIKFTVISFLRGNWILTIDYQTISIQICEQLYL